LEPTSYVPTSQDRLWLLRAVEGEGEPKELVASALVNRFLYLRAKRGSYRRKGLADFVRDYSSPVNPARMRGGKFWEAAWARADARGRRALLALHEKRVRHSTRDIFSPATMQAVDAALTRPPRLPSATDFAAYDHPPSQGLTRVRAGKPGVNALYTADPTWRGYRVETEDTVAPVQTPSKRGPLLAVAAVLVLVVVLAGET
jgi:hypothetical protein